MRKPFLINKAVVACLSIILSLWYFGSIKNSDFQKPYSTVVFSEDHQLLGARIASDGQWRFPIVDSIPDKFKSCITIFEDRFFYEHPGINPVSLMRAVYLNAKHGEIVSGGSTISMQVIRLLKGNKKRTVFRKLYEMLLAVRLELQYTKNDIMQIYASLAPFGGNVVGLNAAAWKYYNRDPHNLSWAETATLAVLPNAPSLIHPDRNREALRKKRNRVLKKLFQAGLIDNFQYEASLLEPLPSKTYALPLLAKHLIDKLNSEKPGEIIHTTISHYFQRQTEKILVRHYNNLNNNHINNIAALIIEVKSGKVKSYAGNVYEAGKQHHHEVDVVQAPRSTGSILKPLLFAALIEEGKISPESIIPDVPVRFADYMPENFSKDYSGAVKAKQALARSLNVPSVLMLKQFGQQKFYHLLENAGIGTLHYPPGHYGLSLILGGAEATLWDLASVYSACAQKLNGYNNLNSNSLRKVHYTEQEENHFENEYLPHRSAVWLMFEALREVNRPVQETGWQYFNSSRKIAWKTGTSFGFKDAWAIGTTPEFVVAVWVGNADGEGRPGLTGIKSAAPVMFDLFNLLPQTSWFLKPYDDMKKVIICRQSGFAASVYCPDKDTIWSSPKSDNLPVCKYHKMVHLNKNLTTQVNRNCYDKKIVSKSWFVLPAHMEYYYKKRVPDYHPLPPWHAKCKPMADDVMQIIFPADVRTVYIPRNLNGSRSELLFEVAHREPSKKVYWHLDDVFLTMTEGIHEAGFFSKSGEHVLTLMDEDGATLSTTFTVVDRDN